MKPFYRVKGKYADKRNIIVIEDREKGKSWTLPKPEKLIEILDTLKNEENNKGEADTSDL